MFIGENVNLKNSVVGPHVSIGDNSVIENSVVANGIIQHETVIKNANLKDIMVGSKVAYNGKSKSISIGDYTAVNE